MSAALVAESNTASIWRDPRSLVTPNLWEREIGLMMRDHPFDRVMAVRVFGQAVAYLVTAMEKMGERLELGPGVLVDIGVHTFILDTKNYRDFCARLLDGGFLDHTPEVEFKNDGTVMRTAQVIAANGFAVDWPLWEADAAKCSPCHTGNDSH